MSKKKSNHALNFFVPHMTEEQAEDFLGKVIIDLEKSGLANNLNERFFSLAHTHNGEDYYVQVGEQDPYDETAKVLAILAGKTYVVITDKRLDIMVGYEDVFGIIPFADYKGTTQLKYRGKS